MNVYAVICLYENSSESATFESMLSALILKPEKVDTECFGGFCALLCFCGFSGFCAIPSVSPSI